MHLHKNEINQLITKYHYDNGQLCYQILAQTHDNQLFVVENFVNYSDYKRALSKIESDLISGTVVVIKECPDKNIILGIAA
jgi:hypothetical protein